MTNPQPPLPPRPPGNREPARRRPVITFDEMVAIFVAFSTIGAILFWSLGGKKGQIVSGWRNGILSSNKTAQTPVNAKGAVRGAFSGETVELASEPTNRYLEPTTESVAANARETTASFVQPDQESLAIAQRPNLINRRTNVFDTTATTATGLALGNQVLKAPDTQTQVTTPAPATPEKAAEVPKKEVPKKVEVTPEKAAETPDQVAKAPEKAAETPKQSALAFKDVPQNHWAYPFVEKLGERKLMLGSSSDIFEPDKLITRATMATLVSRSFNQPKTQKTKNFTDISNQNALAVDINKAVGTGFMKGYSDNEFRPLENIPRYQVLVTLATGLGLKPSQDPDQILSKFKDAKDMPDWAKEQVAAAIEAGLAVNRPDINLSSLKPNEPATRAEVAAMIHQALVESDKLKPIQSKYIVEP